MSNRQVADTIAAQLTRSKNPYWVLEKLVGAKNITYSDTSLSFRFPAVPKTNNPESKGINGVRIELVGDLYTVTFNKIRGLDVTEVSKFEGVYDIMLTELFETETLVLARF